MPHSSSPFEPLEDSADDTTLPPRGLQPGSQNSSQETCPPKGAFSVVVTASEPFASMGQRRRRGASASRSRSMCADVRLGVQYTGTDVARRPRNFIIGLLAVVLLVFFAGSVLLGIWKAPYILLRLAELSVGEVDLMFSGGSGNSPFIDYNEIGPRLNAMPQVRGVAPRWLLRSEARNYVDLRNSRRSDALAEADVPMARVSLLVVDSAQEREIGMGRAWTHRETGYAEAHVFHSVLAYLQLHPNRGERMSMRLPLKEMLGVDNNKNKALLRIHRPTNATDLSSRILNELFRMGSNSTDYVDLLDVFNLEMFVNVADSVTSGDGKYPTLIGNVVVMDYRYLISLLLDQSGLLGSHSIVPAEGFNFNIWTDLFGIPNTWEDFDLRRTAMIVAVLLNDRRRMYYKSEEARSKDMVERSNAIMIDTIGLDFEGSVQFPVSSAMGGYEVMKTILVSSLTCIVVGIVVLCTILFFMLLQANADERQFELATMRAQGMQRRQLILVLVTQTLAFVVPGAGFGVIVLFVLNVIMEVVLARFTEMPPRILAFPVVPILLAVALGVVLPLVSSWGPVSRALNSSLRDALDVYRQVQNEAKVITVKLEELGLATWQVLLGIFLVVAGFLVYYMIPFSFIFENMPLFFLLLDAVLIVMVVGICLIMCVVESYMELGFLWLMMWGSETRFMDVVKKNLHDHRVRNSKAYMMLLVSVACIVSSSVSFEMLSMTTAQLVQISSGADVVVTSTVFTDPLNEAVLTAFLERKRSTHVAEWAYHSFPLSAYPQIVPWTHLETMIRISHGIPVVAVSASLLDTVYPTYVMEDSRDMRYAYPRTVDGGYDVVRSMYDDPPDATFAGGSVIATGIPAWMGPPNISKKVSYVIPGVVASGMRNSVGAGAGDGMVLSYRYNTVGLVVSTKFYVELRALMNRVSGFPGITSSPNSLGSGSVLIPQSFFATLLDPRSLDFGDESNVTLAPGAVTEIRQQKLFVRLQPGLSAAERTVFVNEIQAYMHVTFHTATDTQEVLDGLSAVGEFIMYFFYFTAIVCTSLCTLMMWITFVANVQLNAQMLGVLRALGCSNWQVARMILYEAFSIVFSAFLLGILVGAAVGLTLGLQLATIMVLPFQITLPYTLIGVLFALIVVAAVVGSLLPLRAVSEKNISVVMKGA
ncbi:putative permease-like protein [Trypanosoma grayi]|uniref:putative permease-like protein n=1 Tax=Trypanosoma grayi TaxID=71804 RepID=UPI0004F3F276|nr:putative permease-like protein [Trypanosoma grayi]KEG12834.1 putative permease-like protein [Trypanosoma grayi]